MESDLISREAIRLDIKGWMNSRTDRRTLNNIVDGQPAVDAVEVVWCENCEHRKGRRCPYSTVDLKMDGFCDKGVRKCVDHDQCAGQHGEDQLQRDE